MLWNVMELRGIWNFIRRNGEMWNFRKNMKFQEKYGILGEIWNFRRNMEYQEESGIFEKCGILGEIWNFSGNMKL